MDEHHATRSIPPSLTPAVRDGADESGRPPSLRRVLYVIDLDPSIKFGSLEEQIFSLARAFRERGGEFIPLFRSPLGPEATAMYEAEDLHADALNLSQFRLQTLFELVRLIRRFKIRLVHWNIYASFNPYLWSLSLLTPGVDHWMTDHISRRSMRLPRHGILKRLAKRLLLRRYEKILGVSEFVVECFRGQVRTGNLFRCHHFVNTDRFSPNEVVRGRLRAATGVEKHFVLLAVAYLIPEKGIDVVIRALNELPEHVVLWVVGDGEDASRLRDLSRTLSLDGRIHFWGQQRHVEPYMQAADCLVCPSVWAEAAGLVIVEALASELPVVASAIGGIPEFVKDGMNGYVFPAGDSTALADRIRRLLDDPDLLSAMKTRARTVAVERFSIPARLSEFVGMYRDVKDTRR